MTRSHLHVFVCTYAASTSISFISVLCSMFECVAIAKKKIIIINKYKIQSLSKISSAVRRQQMTQSRGSDDDVYRNNNHPKVCTLAKCHDEIQSQHGVGAHSIVEVTVCQHPIPCYLVSPADCDRTWWRDVKASLTSRSVCSSSKNVPVGGCDTRNASHPPTLGVISWSEC